MDQQQLEANNYLVISYLSLRKPIGFIGLLLPFVLVLGNILFGGAGLETSVSERQVGRTRNRLRPDPILSRSGRMGNYSEQ